MSAIDIIVIIALVSFGLFVLCTFIDIIFNDK